MERNVSVNSGSLEDTPEIEWDATPPDGAVETAARSGSPADQGPCLYLGPGGERCSRRALAGGFCARHAKGTATPVSPTQRGRKAAAIVAAVAALWPLLNILLRELIRWLR